MHKLIRTTAIATTALVAVTAAVAAVDPTKLPLGDGKYTTSVKAGYVDSCQTSFNGGGAQANGPWVGSTTWDSTAKIHIQGTVHWKSTFTQKVVGSRRIIAGNGLPSTPTGTYPVGSSDPAYAYDRNPNSIKAYSLKLSLPANPTAAAKPSCIGGTVGISPLGAPMYSSFDALGRDAGAHEIQDACGGHPQISGQYHFHGLPVCWQSSTLSKKTHLVGWALDGFGIYVEYGSDGKMLGSADLDACHGRTSVVTWDGKQKSMYHYVATQDFPYLVACYKGTPITSATGLDIGSGGGGGFPPGGP